MKIQKVLKAKANSTYAKHSQRFFKTGPGEYGEGDVFMGIRMGDLRAIAKEYVDLEISSVQKLLSSRKHEERMTALIILTLKYSRGKSDADRKQIYSFYIKNFRNINNWDLVDVSCHKVIGKYLENKDRKVLYKWARSKDLWTRRISIVTTWWFIRSGDLDDCFQLSKILLKDSHDLIHKAVGWMLREAGKKDRSRLEEFLKIHYKTMPRTMLRYSIEKFPEKRRQQFLKGLV